MKKLMNFKIDIELKDFLEKYSKENKVSMSIVLNQLILKLKRSYDDGSTDKSISEGKGIF